MQSSIARSIAPFFLALLAACGGGAPEPASFDGNIVLIVVDSLRADRLGLYGYDRPTSPFLDGLAADSVVFDRAWAPSSYTSQSMAAILTGRLPTSGGSIGLLEAEPSGSAVSLPQHFTRAGFRTGIVANQPLLRRRGFTRGFEDIQVTPLENPWTAEAVAARALTFVDDVTGAGPAGGGQQFFLSVYFAEPHQPYDAPADLLERFESPDFDGDVSIPTLQAEIEAGTLADDDPRIEVLRAAYDAEVAAVDRAVEKLFQGLRDRGVLDTTTLVFTASQGEEHREHGYLGHAWTLFEEVLHVPLLVRSPELAAQRVSEPVSLVELSTSLLTLAGVDSAEHSDGDSFLRRRGAELEVGPSGRPKIAELVIRERCIHRAVLDGEWKYLRTVADCPLGERRSIAADYPARLKASADGELELPEVWGDAVGEALYDLSADPGERTDLAAAEPERLERMRGILDNYAQWCRENALQPGEAVAPADMIDPAQAERLESLGYL